MIEAKRDIFTHLRQGSTDQILDGYRHRQRKSHLWDIWPALLHLHHQTHTQDAVCDCASM